MKVIRKTSLLAFIATVFALPIFLGGNSHAETFKTNVDIAPKLMVTLPSSPTQVTVDPAYNQFSYSNFLVQVSTNNPTGYYTTVSSETTNLIKKEDSSKFIPTIEESGYYSSYSFPVNRWGYSTDNGDTYQPFVSGARIASKDTTANGDYINMQIATRVDYLQSPGTYEIELTFVTVVNYLPPSYIQDVNPMTCIEEPRTVVDMRDGEEYPIQKLKDGRCWMMGSLNLGATDLTGNLTSSNTNIVEDISVDTFNEWKNNNLVYPVEGIDEVADIPYGVLYDGEAVSGGWQDSDPDKSKIRHDLCPAGWRIPSTDEWRAMYQRHIGSSMDKLHLSLANGGAAFPLAGIFHGSLVYKDIQARYWSNNIFFGGDFFNEIFLSLDGDDRQFEIDSEMGTPVDINSSVRCILDNPDISQATYLQDVKRAMVYSMNVGDTVTLIDKRDGEEYLVGKLADGRLWLLENLRLDPTAVSLEVLQDNTNATDTSLYYLKNGGGEEPYASSGVVEVPPSVTDEHHEPYVHATDKNTLASMLYDASVKGKSGTFYNYCAASAGSYCYDFFTEDTGDAKEDICPSGWRLPTGGEDGETGNLYESYGSNIIEFAKQFKAVQVGEMHNDLGVIWADRYAPFWTSTFSGHGLMKYLWFDKHYYGGEPVHMGLDTNGSGRGEGMLIRCIIK